MPKTPPKISVYPTEKVKKWVEKKAESEGRSASSYILTLIKKAMKGA